MYKFSEDDKEASDRTEHIPFGVSKVKFVGATASETEAGKSYIEVTVENEDGLEDSARVWFVGGASKYSFDTLRQIVVHNAKTDADKEKARQAVESVESDEDLANLLNSKCVGGELWFTKYYDPQRTYTNANGETKRSINNSIYGYEPKLKPELMNADAVADVNAVIPGATPAAADSIPSEWDK